MPLRAGRNSKLAFTRKSTARVFATVRFVDVCAVEERDVDPTHTLSKLKL